MLQQLSKQNTNYKNVPVNTIKAHCEKSAEKGILIESYFDYKLAVLGSFYQDSKHKD